MKREKADECCVKENIYKHKKKMIMLGKKRRNIRREREWRKFNKRCAKEEN